MNKTPIQNNRKINRALYIVTVTLLFALAVVIAITTAAGRKAKEPPKGNESDSLSGQITESDTTAPITTERKQDTNKPESRPTPQSTSDTEASAQKDLSEPVDVMPNSFTLPVVGILSKGHDNSLQVYSKTMNDYRVHTGIDIVCSENAPVYAAAAGIISQIWDDPLMGNCIAISHGGQCYTVYKNLSEEMVSGIAEGANVSAGQLIAAVGNSAMIEIAEEPHLHFEMTVDGKSADPLDYFDDATLASLMVDASFES